MASVERNMKYRMARPGKRLAFFFAVYFLAGVASAAPRLFYQDLLSAPADAFVTLWGDGFGEQRGSVLVGGRSAEIAGWSKDRIIIRRPKSTGSDLVISDAAGARSGVHRLSFHRGVIYYISQKRGDDKFDGLSELAHAPETPKGNGPDQLESSSGPFRTINAFLQKSKPGDVAYVRDGIYKEVGNPVYDAHLFIGPDHSGTEDKPIALVAYPEEHPIVGSTDHKYGILLFDNIKNWTIAKIFIRGKDAALLMSTLGVKENIRIVANQAKGQKNANGVFQLNSTNNLAVLGNKIRHSGIAGNKFSHLLYYGGYGPGSNVKISWNTLHDQIGGRCLQVYGHHRDDSLVGLEITHNDISRCRMDGILVGGSDFRRNRDWIRNVVISHNTVNQAGGAAIRINSPGLEATIENNQLSSSTSGIQIQEVKEVFVTNNRFLKFGQKPTVVVNRANKVIIENNSYQ